MPVEERVQRPSAPQRRKSAPAVVSKRGDVLGIAQPDVSHLMNGHFSRFTTDKLLDFLKRLDRKVTIEVSRHRKGEPYQQVTFAP